MIDGTKITLGGTEYILPPATLRILRRFLADTAGATTPMSNFDAMVNFVHGALGRNYPDITLEQLEDLVDTDTVYIISDILSKKSGLVKGEAAGNP